MKLKVTDNNFSSDTSAIDSSGTTDHIQDLRNVGFKLREKLLNSFKILPAVPSSFMEARNLVGTSMKIVETEDMEVRWYGIYIFGVFNTLYV